MVLSGVPSAPSYAKSVRLRKSGADEAIPICGKQLKSPLRKAALQKGFIRIDILEWGDMADEKFSGVRALIFDLDGTLIDSKLDLIHSVNAMLREMKRPQLASETISGYIGHGAPQLVARAMGGTATEEELKHGLQFFLGYYEEHKMDNTCASRRGGNLRAAEPSADGGTYQQTGAHQRADSEIARAGKIFPRDLRRK
jgi:hypothetical protein